MTKWEYCVLTWTAGLISAEQRADLEKAGFQGRLQPAENGAAMAQMGSVEYLGKPGSDQIVNLSQFLADLGEEGWELVQVLVLGAGREQFWLKRQF
jgi:hypothetical protein